MAGRPKCKEDDGRPNTAAAARAEAGRSLPLRDALVLPYHTSRLIWPITCSRGRDSLFPDPRATLDS